MNLRLRIINVCIPTLVLFLSGSDGSVFASPPPLSPQDVQSDTLPKTAQGVEENEATESDEPVEIVSIRKTLIDYIEGSTQGQPERLKSAFHEKLNLYSIKKGRLSVWAGTDYIADTKKGSSTGEAGRILSIDFENDIAVAKVEIKQPNRVAYIDYFMLLRIGDEWKIVHKMYTRQSGRSGRFELKGNGSKPSAEESKPRSLDSKSKS